MIFTLYHHNPKKLKTVITALTTMLAVGFMLFAEQSLQLFFTGVLIGFVFIYFNFGFAGYWSSFWKNRETIGVRSHLWLLAFGTLIFFPALTFLPENGIDATGAVRPYGLNVLIGAALFGVGMAISNACSSGTIRLMGEFKLRYYWVFFWMIIGGTFAASESENWMNWEAWGIFSLATDLHWSVGLLTNLSVIAALYIFFLWIEKRKHGNAPAIVSFNKKANHFNKLEVSPLLWATLFLVLLNLVILILSAYPWAISWIFPKLGILGIQFFELPFEWDFWEYTASYESGLAKPWSQDNIMLTTLGLFTGIVAYHLLSKSFPIETTTEVKGVKSIKFTHLLTPIIAGSLMGFGAVISFGCNIGGFFSAIISGSLHGWLWLISAFFALGITTLIISKFELKR